MANTVPNYPSSGDIQYAPLIFTKKLMILFTESTVLNEITNNDYEGEIKGKGDSVKIRVAPIKMNVGAYHTTNDITYETPGEDARTLNIDQMYYSAFQLEEVDEIQSDLGLMNIFVERSALSLNIDTSTRVLAYMGANAFDATAVAAANVASQAARSVNDWNASSSGNSGATAGKVSAGYNLGVATTPVIVTADNAVDLIADCGTVLDEADVPAEGRFIVLPAWYCNFLKKGDLKRVDVTGDSKGVIRTGLIGEIDNFMIYKSNLVSHASDTGPTTPAAVEAFYIPFGVKDATTFASQITKTQTVIAQGRFAELWRSLLVYGREVVQPEALGMLYVTRTSYV